MNAHSPFDMSPAALPVARLIDAQRHSEGDPDAKALRAAWLLASGVRSRIRSGHFDKAVELAGFYKPLLTALYFPPGASPRVTAAVECLVGTVLNEAIEARRAAL